MPRKAKIVPLSERYNLYLDAQQRLLDQLVKRNAPKGMSLGRRLAVESVVKDMEFYRNTNNPVDQHAIHGLLVTLQTKMGQLQDNYKQSGPDERDVMTGQFFEYKRQAEQIRNLLTPMKEGK